jgi:hypothetical protein
VSNSRKLAAYTGNACTYSAIYWAFAAFRGAGYGPSIRFVRRNYFDGGSINLVMDSGATILGSRVVRLYCANASVLTPLVRLFSLLVDPKEWGVCQSLSFPF